jgi:hypothetical protein
MSTFNVIPGAVSDAAARVSLIAPAIQEIAGRGAGHVGAGADTPAAGTIEELSGRWAAVLPQFALAGALLSAAVARAAAAYAQSDQALANAADIAVGQETHK